MSAAGHGLRLMGCDPCGGGENLPDFAFTPEVYVLVAYIILYFFKNPIFCIALLYEQVMFKKSAFITVLASLCDTGLPIVA